MDEIFLVQVSVDNGCRCEDTTIVVKVKDEKSAEDIINQYHIMNSNNDTSIIVKTVKKVDKDEKIIFLNNFDEMIK